MKGRCYSVIAVIVSWTETLMQRAIGNENWARNGYNAKVGD